MKSLGYILIVISMPACLMTFGLDWLYGDSTSRFSLTALPTLSCFFTVASFLAGLGLIKGSDASEKARRENEAIIAQQKAQEIQQQEDKIIKKWIDKQPE